MESLFVWLGIFVCLSQSAILSGLDLACFAVSRVQLEIESSDSNPDAIKVLELRKDSNFLLTTILWGNMGSNTLLALLSGSVLGGVAAFLFSTIFLTVFSEIIPQAYFSRNALRIAALLSPIVKVYQFVLYPVAKPSAKALDPSAIEMRIVSLPVICATRASVNRVCISCEHPRSAARSKTRSEIS